MSTQTLAPTGGAGATVTVISKPSGETAAPSAQVTAGAAYEIVVPNLAGHSFTSTGLREQAVGEQQSSASKTSSVQGRYTGFYETIGKLEADLLKGEQPGGRTSQQREKLDADYAKLSRSLSSVGELAKLADDPVTYQLLKMGALARGAIHKNWSGRGVYEGKAFNRERNEFMQSTDGYLQRFVMLEMANQRLANVPSADPNLKAKVSEACDALRSYIVDSFQSRLRIGTDSELPNSLADRLSMYAAGEYTRVARKDIEQARYAETIQKRRESLVGRFASWLLG
jgi:hypothetical protein